MDNRCVPIGHTILRAYTATDAHLYGVLNGQASDKLYKEDADGVQTLVRDMGDLEITDFAVNAVNVVENCFALSDSALFVVCYTTLGGEANKRFLFKSVDGGVSFGDNAPAFDNKAFVTELGELGGTHTALINILGQRGFLEATNGNLYFIEYNTNGSRTTGSTNDQVRLFESTDSGTTWSVIWNRNTDGTHQTTHGHLITQDPYTGDIYIGFGDGASDSGIVKWDGVTAFIDNATHAELDAIDGFSCLYGSTRHQTTELIFTEDYVINPVDNGAVGDDDNRGIFKFPRDMSSYTRVDYQSTDNGHSMYLGKKLSTGELIATNLHEGTSFNLYYGIYVSIDDGETWVKSGRVNLQEAAFGGGSYSPTEILEFNGKIYIGSTKQTTRTSIGSVIFKLDGTWTGEMEIISPVFWIDPSGSDSANGYTDTTPFATLKKALENDVGTYGMRVILSAGYHECLATTLDYQAATFDGQPEHEVIVEGVQGRSILRYDTGNLGQGVTLGAGDGDITFKWLRVYSLEGNPLLLDSGYDGVMIDQTVKGKVNWQ